MSTIKRGYKYQIYPNEDQKLQLNKFINLFRYVYNWGVAKEKEVYEQYKQGLSEHGFYNFIELCSIFTYERNNNPDLYWLKEIPNTTARLALRNVVNAYKRFFSGENNHPRFKSKKKCRKREASFNTRNDRFKIKDDKIKIEGIESYISLDYNTGFDIDRCINPCVSRDHFGNYFISFSLEEESTELNIPKSEPIGIDLGIKQTFVLSTGESFNQPKEKLNKLEHRRRRIDRHVTRDINRSLKESMRTKTKYEDIPKSKRAIKRETKRKRLYDKIHNIKDTFYHTITKQIVMRNPEFVCMETFSVMKIEKDYKYMSKYLSDTSFYDITRKMKDKCALYNIPFIQALREFASTQICSNCGGVKKMYNNRTYKCPVCGMVMDRDINAAINLRNYGYRFI